MKEEQAMVGTGGTVAGGRGPGLDGQVLSNHFRQELWTL